MSSYVLMLNLKCDGAYGEIYLVKWRGTNVAAKTIRPSIASNSKVNGSYLRRYINTSYIVDFGDTKQFGGPHKSVTIGRICHRKCMSEK
ncbi:hypothetical protein MRB53_003582 [Persea americana]|uniref:Uncharacterized protein n=1 Tax=Persea americana TaxID=3435 RepID=A0ACC2MY22_PERAE|nr:hypothetical protein MRB53_003582 [Persea americana]